MKWNGQTRTFGTIHNSNFSSRYASGKQTKIELNSCHMKIFKFFLLLLPLLLILSFFFVSRSNLILKLFILKLEMWSETGELNGSCVFVRKDNRFNSCYQRWRKSKFYLFGSCDEGFGDFRRELGIIPWRKKQVFVLSPSGCLTWIAISFHLV